MQTAVFLVNRIPSLTVLEGRSPYEILYDCSFPDLQLVRIFECLYYPDIQDIAAHKLSPRSLPCIFLGLINIKIFTVSVQKLVKFLFPDMLLLLKQFFPHSYLSKFSSSTTSNFQLF